MTTEVLTMVLTAGVQSTAGQGRMFYVKTASAPLTITCDIKGTGGTVRRFVNIPAGFKFKVDEARGWTYLRILSVVSQSIELILGDDDVDVANAVSVTGTASVDDSSAAITDTPAVALPNTTTTAVIAGGTRRRVTLTAPLANTGSIFVRMSAASANNLLELQPGTFAEFRTKAGLWCRNDTGAAQSVLVLEET